jgi:hypothetical protein
VGAPDRGTQNPPEHGVKLATVDSAGHGETCSHAVSDDQTTLA